AFATGAGVVAIPTLEVIAQNALNVASLPDRVAVVLDAKRKRVYTATFERRDSRYVPLNDPRETEPSEYLTAQTRRCAVLGEGVAYHREAVEASGLLVLPENIYLPRAETVYRLGAERAQTGQSVSPRDLIPIYIRPPEAEEVWNSRYGVRGA